MSNLNYTTIVTMSYDLDTTHDTNINSEIKSYLQNYGWHFDCPETTVIQGGVERTERNDELPSTTAWKVDCTPEQAMIDFRKALTAYDTAHIVDNPPKKGRGHAFAILNNHYDCIWIK